MRIREQLIEHYHTQVVATAGLIAHGRGEAFDYIIGEKTTKTALTATKVAAAAMLLAHSPVFSVNGNVAALASKHVVKVAEAASAKIEINLFYRSDERDRAIESVLRRAGAKKILGVGNAPYVQIPEISSERRHVDRRGIFIADTVLVPLEDGDRTEALQKMGKTVIAIDLNPLSRTAQLASITIVDNVIRALPNLLQEIEALKDKDKKTLQRLVSDFDNIKNLSDAIRHINQRLNKASECCR
jgi:4-phosphopantoate--beta-alanine ligase